MKNTVAKLDHINFTVTNFKESVEWYQKVFNLELVEKEKCDNGLHWGILRGGDTMLCIGEEPQRKPYHGEEYLCMYHFGLRVLDKEAWEKTIKEHDLEIKYSGPIKYPHSTSWYVDDPSGNEIEVVVWNDDKVKFPEQKQI